MLARTVVTLVDGTDETGPILDVYDDDDDDDDDLVIPVLLKENYHYLTFSLRFLRNVETSDRTKLQKMSDD